MRRKMDVTCQLEFGSREGDVRAWFSALKVPPKLAQMIVFQGYVEKLGEIKGLNARVCKEMNESERKGKSGVRDS